MTRVFDSGAIRDTAVGKPDFEGYLSPLVIRKFGEYMLTHQIDPDGNPRASDNWQKGFPRGVLMSSLWRHFVDVWAAHRGHDPEIDIADALCAVLFNAMAYLHAVLEERKQI